MDICPFSSGVRLLAQKPELKPVPKPDLKSAKKSAENIRRSFESRISELESGVETKESEMSSKLVQLERMSEERNSAESKSSALETELDEIRCRELTLAKEMELLNQVI